MRARNASVITTTGTARGMSESKARRRKFPLVVVGVLLMALIAVFAVTARPRNKGDGAVIASSATAEDYNLAFDESFGYFDDIPSKEWMIKKRISARRVHVPVWQENTTSPQVFYQNLWNPDFTCGETQAFGMLGKGGAYVCNVDRLNQPGCVVYSIGQGSVAHYNFTFERALQDRAPHCEFHLFDFAPLDDIPSGMIFHQVGLRTTDGRVGGVVRRQETQQQKLLLQSLPEIVASLGHKTVSFLRLDCETCEWMHFHDLTRIDVRQMLLTAHRYDEPTTTPVLFQHMHDEGYVIFKKEAKVFGRCKGCDMDFSFLKLHPNFQKLNR